MLTPPCLNTVHMWSGNPLDRHFTNIAEKLLWWIGFNRQDTDFEEVLMRSFLSDASIGVVHCDIDDPVHCLNSSARRALEDSHVYLTVAHLYITLIQRRIICRCIFLLNNISLFGMPLKAEISSFLFCSMYGHVSNRCITLWTASSHKGHGALSETGLAMRYPCIKK